MFYIKHIKNEEHYDFLLNQALLKAEKFLWIGTADLKDLHYKKGKSVLPVLHLLNSLIQKGVNIRLLHAKEPGKKFMEDFDKYPSLWKNLERSLCTRVHFKIIVVDGTLVYSGSANLTGAAFGMRSINSRNFESGIVSNDPELVENIMSQFDTVWSGLYCDKCKYKNICPDPIC